MRNCKGLVFIIITALLSSCTVYDKIGGKAVNARYGNLLHSKSKVEAPSKQKKRTDDVPATPAQYVAPTAEELSGGQWAILSVGDVQIDMEDEQPYIVFDRRGRFYAGDGCNILNGDYVLRSDARITFGNVISTMKYCPELDFAPSVASFFSDGAVYSADCKRIGQETYIYLKDAKGVVKATLRRHNMEFLNGNWRITAAEGLKIDADDVNLFIDVYELRVHGNTGCNYFNGTIYIDPKRSNAIDFSNMSLTRMACPDENRERAVMVALERAAAAIAGQNENTVLLLDAAGKQAMTLERLPLPNEKNDD